MKAAHKGVDKSQNIDDGELREGVPADKNQRVDEKAETQVVEKSRVPGEPVLEEENECQDQKTGGEQPNPPASQFPGLNPHGFVGRAVG